MPRASKPSSLLVTEAWRDGATPKAAALLAYIAPDRGKRRTAAQWKGKKWLSRKPAG